MTGSRIWNDGEFDRTPEKETLSMGRERCQGGFRLAPEWRVVGFRMAGSRIWNDEGIRNDGGFRNDEKIKPPNWKRDTGMVGV